MPKTKNDEVETVATSSQNTKLKHSRGGVTTRDDLLDLGVPMLQGDASEPQGPEDALGPGPKRGDYTGRVRTGVQTISEPVDDADEDEATAKLVLQSAAVGGQAVAGRVTARGEVKGVKGGVDTEDDS